jgi:hypothetical protein
MGRPSSYTEAVGDLICERIANGESLRAICRDEEMPALSTVFRWLSLDASFSEQYARAREEQADTYADEIVAISDEEATTVKVDDEDVRVVFDATAVARNRLRVDARKWVASKLKPKKYGERQVLAGDPEAPLRGLTDEELETKLAAKLEQLGIAGP